MRFLVDANLSPVVASALRDAGHDSVHVIDLGLFTADDDRILDEAAHDDRVILTADADFGALLAIGGLAKRPSCSSGHRTTSARPSRQRYSQGQPSEAASLGQRPAGGVEAAAWDRAAARIEQHRVAFGISDDREPLGSAPGIFDDAYAASRRAAQEATHALEVTLWRDHGIERQGPELSL